MKMYVVSALLLSVVYMASASSLRHRRSDDEQDERSIDSFNWRHCNGFDPAASPWQIQSMEVSPMPLLLPGQAYITYHSTSSRAVNNVDVKMNIVKETRFGNFRIPCIMELGSCTYQRACDMLEAEEGEEHEDYVVELKQLLRANGLPETCPILAQPMHIDRYAFTIPPLPALTGFAVTGNYNITISVKETGTDVMLACMNMRIRMEEPPAPPCDSWWCSITG